MEEEEKTGVSCISNGYIVIVAPRLLHVDTTDIECFFHDDRHELKLAGTSNYGYHAALPSNGPLSIVSILKSIAIFEEFSREFNYFVQKIVFQDSS